MLTAGTPRPATGGVNSGGGGGIEQEQEQRQPQQQPLMFSYLRKNRKTSGTQQQLEGPAAGALERRAMASGALRGCGGGRLSDINGGGGGGGKDGQGPTGLAAATAAAVVAAADCDEGPVEAIWVDDVLSTGSSLADGVQLMRDVYGVKVVGAVFLIDRSVDRQQQQQQQLQPVNVCKEGGSEADTATARARCLSDDGKGVESSEVLLRGLDVVAQADDVRFSIGVALQEAGLDENMTGREILATQGRLFGLNRSEIADRIEQLAPILEMRALDQLVSSYSGGMARRLDLAAALMHNPSVLFLDEPTTGLDPPSRLRVWEEVRRLNREFGLTLFLTTQYLEEADELADRVGIINAGRIVAEGTPGELKRAIGTDVVTVVVDGDADAAKAVLEGIGGIEGVDVFGDEVRVGTENGSQALSPVAIALGSAGIKVRELSLRTPTLDDVFLDVTGTHLDAGSSAEGSST